MGQDILMEYLVSEMGGEPAEYKGHTITFKFKAGPTFRKVVGVIEDDKGHNHTVEAKDDIGWIGLMIGRPISPYEEILDNAIMKAMTHIDARQRRVHEVKTQILKTENPII